MVPASYYNGDRENNKSQEEKENFNFEETKIKKHSVVFEIKLKKHMILGNRQSGCQGVCVFFSIFISS